MSEEFYHGFLAGVGSLVSASIMAWAICVWANFNPAHTSHSAGFVGAFEGPDNKLYIPPHIPLPIITEEEMARKGCVQMGNGSYMCPFVMQDSTSKK